MVGSRCEAVGPAWCAVGVVAAPAPAAPAGHRLVPTPVAPPRPFVADAAQRRVIEHPGGPLLVLAGPGTGKTATLVEAVAARIEAGVDPRSILVLTFSRRAAGELRERITARLGPGGSGGAEAGGGGGPGVWTFHAWCLALLRAHDRPAPQGGFRLLSGPERDSRLRELIEGSREDGHPVWPPQLARALGTRGFTEEVRALLARAREVGLEPVGLAQLARRTDRPDWAALAEFYQMYLDVFGFEGALDYADLVHRAVVVAEGAEAGEALRARYQHVFVDEYQDTDPAQERLLRAVAGGGRDLVVFGDPDQSIYAFRGAEVAGLLDFPQRFGAPGRGAGAPIVALRTGRRMAPAPLQASRHVARRIPAAGLPVAEIRAHRDLIGRTDLGAGRVQARTYQSAGAEAEAVADLLRREHLENATPWPAMAVLVRTADRIARLRRVLTAAGVPVSVDGDDLPVAQEPAAALLLLALRCADDPTGALTVDAARTLLTSPLGGADPAGLRELGRALRAFDRDAGAGQPAASAELVREAVAEPDRWLVRVADPVARPARRVGDLLVVARRALREPAGSPEQALWALWSASGWQQELVAASAAGGAAGRAADRDLDAVVALFDAVARLAQRRGTGAASLVDELGRQQIAADAIAPVGEDARRRGVRLLTAHRAKGLEWDVVAVCGVQDGIWPDLRERHSLLGAEQLDAPARGGLRPPLTRQDLLADERRLFYVALTRARRRLLVTAVNSPDDDGSLPSRLLDELGVAVENVPGRPTRPLTLVGLVATLRRLATEPTSSPALRAAARRRLAALAAARDDAHRPLVPAAHPTTWWGLLDVTDSDVPVVAPGAPLRLSGSSLSSIGTCSLRWFLEHEAHAVTVASTAQGFGKVVHALADEVTTGRTPADLAALDARLDTVWRHLDYEARWRSDQERAAAREALARFLAWHAGERGRRVIDAEVRFTCRLQVAGREVMLRGFIDRLELDDAGRVHVIDFKTGRSAPGRAELATHPQLGSYQLAVRTGALDAAIAAASPAAGRPGAVDPAAVDPAVADPAVPGGAELVQLRRDAGGAGVGPRLPGEAPGPPEVQAQEALPAEGPTWMDDVLGEAVRTIDAEAFRPTPGEHCTMCTFQTSCPARPEGRQVIE